MWRIKKTECVVNICHMYEFGKVYLNHNRSENI